MQRLSYANLMCTPSAGAPSWVVHDILKVERIGLMEVKVGEKGDGNKRNAKGANTI
jgi:hypothetical protein